MFYIKMQCKERKKDGDKTNENKRYKDTREL